MRHQNIRSEADRERSFTRRTLFLGAATGTLGAALVARLGWLSLAEREKYATLAEQNRVQIRLVPPRRGWIVDRAGKPLAQNRPDYALELTAELAGDDIDATLARIREVIPIDPDEEARIKADIKRLPRSVPVSVATDIGWDAYAAVNVRLADVPGLTPVRGFAREYPDGPAFGHLLGYVGRPTQEQYRATRDPLLIFPGFRLGKDGIERVMEPQLRGSPGARRVEVTATGRIVRELDSRPDRQGGTVRLTIDRDLQAFAARRIGDESASCIVVDVTNGDLLCMLSMPAFDPNVFSDRIPSALWRQLQEDDHHPLINKTVQGLYPPGSTFKMITALAILDAGISPEDGVVCTGRYMLGSHPFHCWKRRGHGYVNMHSGIFESCDTYFYHMSRRIGPDRIAAVARKLGLGQRYDLPLPTQRRGIVPDPAWKMQRYKEPWLPGQTLNIAIGQGYLISTPLQLGVMAARLASGRQVEPRLLADSPPRAFAPLELPTENLAVIHQAMADVVNSPRGTATGARLRVDGVQMAGKTGTAQVRRITMAERRSGVRSNESLPWRFRDHALFVAFAPVENPRYAAAVVVEHGSSGSKAAAPIARDVLTFLYDRTRAERDLGVLDADRQRRRAAAEARARAEAARAALADGPSVGIVGQRPADPPAEGAGQE